MSSRQNFGILLLELYFLKMQATWESITSPNNSYLHLKKWKKIHHVTISICYNQYLGNIHDDELSREKTEEKLED